MSCIEEDCDEPRYKTYSRCEDCYKAYERERKKKQKQKKEASPTLEELYDAPQWTMIVVRISLLIVMRIVYNLLFVL